MRLSSYRFSSYRLLAELHAVDILRFLFLSPPGYVCLGLFVCWFVCHKIWINYEICGSGSPAPPASFGVTWLRIHEYPTFSLSSTVPTCPTRLHKRKATMKNHTSLIQLTLSRRSVNLLVFYVAKGSLFVILNSLMLFCETRT